MLCIICMRLHNMVNEYEVVTDTEEIARLNAKLAEVLRSFLPHFENREITYPAGHHAGDVYFEVDSGQGIRAWSPFLEPEKFANFFLFGEPGVGKWMEIAVQLNFPRGEYHRRNAGAFVRDAAGELFVAHRGKLTKGNAGLHKSKVFREFAAQVVQADDKKLQSTVILIGALSDPLLPDRLWQFAEEARRVATKLAGEIVEVEPPTTPPPSSGPGKGGSTKQPATPEERLMKLRDYFDEHSGETTVEPRAGGVRVVEHGDVVKALEAHLAGRGKHQKAQAIDLAVVGDAVVELYEVKTSGSTTNVYTGIGQLAIHGASIKELLSLPVQCILVLPEEPHAAHARQIRSTLGVRIALYQKAADGYRFTGLQAT